MVARSSLTLHLILLGAHPVEGLCDQCYNPALIQITYTVAPPGRTPTGLHSSVICHDCHTKEHTEAE